MLEQALDSFGEKCAEVLGVDPLSLFPWMSSIMAQAETRAQTLTSAEEAEILDWAGVDPSTRQSRLQWSTATDRELSMLRTPRATYP